MQYYRIDTPQLPISLFGTGLFGYPEPQVGPLPQKGPIYYVNTDSLGHTENRENKTDAPISCQEAVCGSVLSNSHRSS